MGACPVRVFLTHPGASLYGSDRMLLESLRGMIEAGMDPVVVLPEEGPLATRAREWGVRVLLRPMPVLRKSALSPWGVPRLVTVAAAAAVRDIALLTRSRPDVVYVSTLTTPTWVLLPRLLGIPVVCHVHEAESTAARWVQRALSAPLLAANRILVNSEHSRAVLLRSWPDMHLRTDVVRNGVPGPTSAAAPRRAEGGGRFRLLFVGRLSERKGVLVALDAFEAALVAGLDAHLDVVGDTFVEHVGFARLLQHRLRDEVFQGRVTVHGFATDVWGHLAECDVLLVPSVLPEPFGNTAVEGALAGRPVIASDTGGLPEALRGIDSARLVPPGDAGALARAVLEVAADRATLVASAVAAAPAAAARYAPRRYRDRVAASVTAVLR